MDQSNGPRSFKGNLSDRPFPLLLFSLWQERATGRLKISGPSLKKELDFLSGSIVFSGENLMFGPFCQGLVKKGLLGAEDLKSYKDTAREHNGSLIRIFMEQHVFTPDRFWQLMEEYVQEDLFSLFDRPDGEFFFDAEKDPSGTGILLIISVPEFIRQGVDRMENFDVFKKNFPGNSGSVLTLSPRSKNRFSFRPHEKYLMNVIENHKNLEDIYRSSELGTVETQRVLFYLLCTGILVATRKAGNDHWASTVSQTEIQDQMEDLNKKCAYIHKFMTKEIGPVSLKVLEKSINEINGYLSPLFKGVKLQKDGRIDIKSILKAQMTPSGRRSGKYLFRDLNEILAAEVLAVKKTIGSKKESLLIKNLKEI